MFSLGFPVRANRAVQNVVIADVYSFLLDWFVAEHSRHDVALNAAFR